jgi:hypothetical protein
LLFFNCHMLCPSILIRRWYRPIVMGISYVNSYSFNGHMLCPNKKGKTEKLKVETKIQNLIFAYSLTFKF